MAIAEVLKVTHRMDDKIRVLIDGAQCCFSCTSGYPKIFHVLALTQQSMNEAGEEKRSSHLDFLLVFRALLFS